MADNRITRIPLNIVVTATGQETEGVLVAVMASDLDALEATVEDLRAALELANTPLTDATCESCGADADVRLPDGSPWCHDCNRVARDLGYDDLEVVQ